MNTTNLNMNEGFQIYSWMEYRAYISMGTLLDRALLYLKKVKFEETGDYSLTGTFS
jgi:hypothetical protein